MSSNKRAEYSIRRRNQRKNKELGTLSENSETKKNANNK